MEEKRFCTCGYYRGLAVPDPRTCVPEWEKNKNFVPILDYWEWEEGTYFYTVTLDSYEYFWDYEDFPPKEDIDNIVADYREDCLEDGDEEDLPSKVFINKYTLKYNEKEEIEEYRWYWDVETVKEIDLD